MEEFAIRPLKAKAATRPKKKADKFSLTRNGLLRGLRDRGMSWAATRWIEVHNPTSGKTHFL